jgi:DNA polymerase-1
MSTLYLIDGSGFLFRAFHALPHLSNAAGQATNALYGFTQMLLRLQSERRPTHWAVALDPPGPPLRRRIDPEYKAHRPPMPEELRAQLPYLPRLLDAFRIPRVEVAPYEADDVIATMTSHARAAGLDVVVVSSDKDLMQLVDEHVHLLDTLKNVEFGPREVEDKWGVPPEKLGDLLALMGDTSDNIPGVEGIGPKTAAQLLQTFGSLEAILRAASDVEAPGSATLRGARRERLARDAEAARRSRRLVALHHEVPIPQRIDELRVSDPDGPTTEALLAELGFDRLARTLAAVGGGASNAIDAAPRSSPVDRSTYRTVTTEAELQELLERCRAAGELAVDTETTSVDPVRAELCGLSVATLATGDVVQAWYIPVGHRYVGAPPQLAEAHVLARLKPLLEDPAVRKYGQNHKYELVVLGSRGVELRGIHCDPMIASYLLDPSRPSHGLSALALAHLDHGMIEYTEVCGTGNTAVTFDQIDLPRATEYSAEDADVTLRLGRRLVVEVERDDALGTLLHDVEIPLSRILATMERHGVALDVPLLRRLSHEVGVRMVELEREVRAVAGEGFNVSSPKQLQALLYDELKLPRGRKTKTGFSVDAEALEELAPLHPIPAKIQEHRTLQKLKSTYLDVLPALLNPKTGRLHPSYNQAVAATGRLSSSDPNVQNIPIRTALGREIRRAFVAEPGHLLMAADYSQIELRVLAHLCQDPILLDAFARDEDIHTRTAREVFGVKTVTAEMRRIAKGVNFGVIYGQGDFGLARQLGIDRAVAHRYIEDYFQRYARVREYMDETIEQARTRGYVTTLLGRRRPLPDLSAKNFAVRAAAERMARNTPIQGSAADIIKLAMIRTQAMLDDAQRTGRLGAKMLLTVHDELVFEVPKDELEPTTTLVRQAMEQAVQLSVPLRVDIGTGLNWAQAHG